MPRAVPYQILDTLWFRANALAGVPIRVDRRVWQWNGFGGN